MSQIYRETALLLKTVKGMLYLGNVFLRYFLIYNLEVSYNFHLIFLQLNVIKMFTIRSKDCFLFLTLGYFFELPITGTFFDFP